MNITYNELIAKAKETKTFEEFAALAKEYKIELPDADLHLYYDKLHAESGELSDEEIENISGGGCGDFADGRHGVLPW